MKYELVITVLDERIAGIVKENIESKTNYHCELRPAINHFENGENVQLTYCDDDTIYTVDQIQLDRHNNMIYHLKGCQGWKAAINLITVG